LWNARAAAIGPGELRGGASTLCTTSGGQADQSDATAGVSGVRHTIIIILCSTVYNNNIMRRLSTCSSSVALAFRVYPSPSLTPREVTSNETEVVLSFIIFYWNITQGCRHTQRRAFSGNNCATTRVVLLIFAYRIFEGKFSPRIPNLYRCEWSRGIISIYHFKTVQPSYSA